VLSAEHPAKQISSRSFYIPSIQSRGAQLDVPLTRSNKVLRASPPAITKVRHFGLVPLETNSGTYLFVFLTPVGVIKLVPHNYTLGPGSRCTYKRRSAWTAYGKTNTSDKWSQSNIHLRAFVSYLYGCAHFVANATNLPLGTYHHRREVLILVGAQGFQEVYLLCCTRVYILVLQ
jgi:hypothetical protein